MSHQCHVLFAVLTPIVALSTLVVGQTPKDSQASDRSGDPYTAPRTSWGAPDLHGIWTLNDGHGIPFERPDEDRGKDVLTEDEALARRERATLSGIWGYDREWHDTALGFSKTAPSRQVAVVIDPPDGKIPPLVAAARERVPAEIAARQAVERAAENPEDLGSMKRCITRGLPRMWEPVSINNGVQIVQAPGYVAMTKEMIHETRIIPTDGRPHLRPDLTQYTGDSVGHWEGDTLVVDVTNFNGKADPFRGSGATPHLVERFTRVSPDRIEYEFTIDDPTVWSRSWTGMYPMRKDDSQYELVEYACHEGNYGMTNMLSGARAHETKGTDAAR